MMAQQEWECSACTFINGIKCQCCKMCQTPAPPHTKPPNKGNSAKNPEFLLDAPAKSKNKFKIHIGIDFGTDGVGLAYTLPNEIDNEPYIHTKWTYKRYAPKVKPETVILLDEDNTPIGFGKDARLNYGMNKSMQDKWMLFERFKMSLYDDYINETVDNDDEKKESQSIHIKDELTAINGKKVKSGIVFIAAFKHLQEETKKYMKINKITKGMWKEIKDSDIQWIITVPAIWNDAAKYQMRQWTIDAGLVDEYIEDQCKIVYEPDCASLSIQHHIKKTNDSYFKKGDKYILVDAGGGTVDVACHEILREDGEFGVKEVLHPTGGPWGSCYIDDQYIKLLQDIFSKEWMNEVKSIDPKIYIELLRNFESVKETFSGNKESLNVRLPLDFVGFMQDKLEEKNDADDDLDDFVSLSLRKLFGTSSVSLYGQTLKLSVKVWKSMFDHVMNPTINHIKKLLNEPKLMGNCKYLCLAGGLSASSYFQSRMRKEFGSKSRYKLELIIPQRPILSVVEGAALLGITNNYIQARVLRYTYGESIHFGVDYAEDMDIPCDWIDKNKTYDEETDEWIVENCFDIIAKQNEEVYTGDIKTNTGRRSRPNQMEVYTDIMFSDMANPKTIDEAQDLGRIKTVFRNKKKTNMELTLEFHFDEALIKIITYPTNEPNNKQTRYITNYNDRAH